ncbi:hypothetical protein BGX38DRAFT_62102 [Terfezia claveryi]|nr:hypothetical protein BGX38DRAFT_62102 [Terfezia claveryi]
MNHSVKEYLIAGKWTEAEAHAIAAKSCLAALIENISEHGPQRTRSLNITLLEYADSYWLEHVSEGCAGPSRQTFKQPFCVFLGSPALPSPSYGNWICRRQQFSRELTAWIEINCIKSTGPPPPQPYILGCRLRLLITAITRKSVTGHCANPSSVSSQSAVSYPLTAIFSARKPTSPSSLSHVSVVDFLTTALTQSTSPSPTSTAQPLSLTSQSSRCKSSHCFSFFFLQASDCFLVLQRPVLIIQTSIII